MALTDDPTPISYIIANYWQLIETPTVSATFNNFSFQLFLTNTDEIDPAKPFISFEQFLDEVKTDAGQHFVQMFHFKSHSGQRL
jgi:hypothetical protein